MGWPATVVLGVCIALFLFSLVMLARNNWVYAVRRKIARYCFDRDASEWWELGRPEPDDFLPSYDAMMYRFWVWDVRKFLKRPLDLDERARATGAA